MSNDVADEGATLDNGAPLHNPKTNTAADHADPPDEVEELKRWKEIARKMESRAENNAQAAKELAALKASSMTELERAVAETRAATLREVGATRVSDAFRLAAVGRPLNIDAALAGLDPNRFMDDEGQPLVKEIQMWVDGVAPAPVEQEPQAPRVPTGHRGPTTALNDDDNLLRDLKTALRI